MPQHHTPSLVVPGGLDAHVAMMPLAQLSEQLHASERGLTQAEAQKRLLASGPNEPVAHRRGNGMRHMLAFASNPLVVILLLASLVSGLLNDVANATIIALMVLLSMVLNAVQTYRSQQAAERLRDEVAPQQRCCGMAPGSTCRGATLCPVTSFGWRPATACRLMPASSPHVTCTSSKRR